MARGIDYAWGRPGGAHIKAAGYDFVCRYLSHNSEKNIDKKEYNDLLDNGLGVVLVWETTEQRPLTGRNAGVQDAQNALDQATALGWPSDRPIYFAADWDFNMRQQDAIEEYMKGVNSVLGVERSGIYGGLLTVQAQFDRGTIKYGWQTLAWSHGHWDSRAQLRQINTNTNMVHGADCDINESISDDFGQTIK